MIELYTDGSCPRNPGPGGWAFCIVGERNGGGITEIKRSGCERATTNNRMEMVAVIKGLEWLVKNGYGGERVLVVSDSQYVIRGLEQWCFSWKKNGWRRKNEDGKMVKIMNPDLWPRLFGLAHVSMRAEFRWQRGHVGHKYNELCDRLAGEAVGQLIEEE